MEWQHIYVGDFNGRLMSAVLMEWAEDNEMHESGEVCHCDVCQIFVPMVVQMEAQLQAAQTALALGLEPRLRA